MGSNPIFILFVWLFSIMVMLRSVKPDYFGPNPKGASNKQKRSLIMSDFPTLYKKDKTDGIRVWEIFTKEDSIFTSHGRQDGKMQL